LTGPLSSHASEQNPLFNVHAFCPNPQGMKQEIKYSLKSFLLELLVYAGLVTIYYLSVLHFLGDTLKNFYVYDRKAYAGIALVLIIGQGFLLEILTRLLLAWIKPRTEDQ
jgi:hypothetical protein